MTSVIKIKRSSVSGNPAVLGAGELAYSSLTDSGSNGGDRLYIGTGTETLGNAVNHVVIGGKYFTDVITAATNTNNASTLVKRDATGSFSAGSISASLLGNASTASTWQTSQNLSLTGDGTATFSNVDGSTGVNAAFTLATVNANSGSFGGLTSIPVVTVNAKGLVTGVSTVTIPTVSNILSGTGVTRTFDSAGNNITLSIGQPVATTDNVTFNNVSVNGSLNSDDITAANISVAGNATITGNLTVQGTTTTINSTVLAVGDLNIVLAKDAISATGANGAGLTVLGPATPATITYSSTDDRWNLNKALNVSTVYGALSGNASTATTLATTRAITATGDAAWTVSFNGSAAVSAALTLATVNTNVGTFGNSTTVPTFTVNAKGLVTAASSTAIPTATTSINGLASFDSANFTVTSGAVTITAIEGGTY